MSEINKLAAKFARVSMNEFKLSGSSSTAYRVRHGWLNKKAVDELMIESDSLIAQHSIIESQPIRWLRGQLLWRIGEHRRAADELHLVVEAGGRLKEEAKRALEKVLRNIEYM